MSGTTNGSSNSNGLPRQNPSDKGSRFGGLAGSVETSVRNSIDKHLGSWTAPFSVSPQDMNDLAEVRTRGALGTLLEKAIVAKTGSKKDVSNTVTDDVEAVPPERKLQEDIKALVGSLQGGDDSAADNDTNADIAANVLTTVLLRSSPESGLDPREVDHRRNVFGSNAIAEKPTDSFLKLCWEAVQDFVLIMLIILGIISIIVEVVIHPENAKTNWIEGAAILISVCIVVFVTASIDYAKQFAFLRLTRSLHDTNTKQVIRDAEMVPVTDDDIVVGDILSVNAHNLASIPADCVLLGPLTDLQMNESSLTGESKLIRKRPGDVILSGTEVSQGSGKMVVIAVGVYSVAGRIKARVYESEEADKMEGEDENSPLFVKLDAIAKKIGMAGIVAALLAFTVSCIIGLAVNREPWSELITYLVTAITVLAVAVPEGLPLAVTLALAFSSNKMMKEQNLVKHLDACETMGCATTICTDKTGTLTANKMTARALYSGGKNYVPENPSVTLGDYVLKGGCEEVELIVNGISINTMNETVLNSKGGSGNPTEVALLHLVKDLGHDYQEIRSTTKGRSDQGALGEFLAMGRQFEFTSARKMMSWAVPLPDGGYRLYCKGASEVVVSRCIASVVGTTETVDMSDETKDEVLEVALGYARRGMRCLALAYRDLPSGFDFDSKSTEATNSDGTPASEGELDLNFIGLVGIEDPLRSEVPGAIARCYEAGIDVRLVTGDNPNTAVSIAFQAGILRDFHFQEGTSERVAINLKDNVLMEGKDFRENVFRVLKDGTKEFDQTAFDKIWPFLRVLARSSPDDKLTLAHGLNQSNLFADKTLCSKISAEHNIRIFPDRQVVAMTGDGTNDAPALKRADIGFAMGVAGTQIAKDAADIILLDDNFASIVTAAKWGRNVYASIQKFLQFQLTVNIAAVITALVGAFVYQQSPLAAIQLLWVNLLMDSLASLALASEPPVEELLQKPPVNRTDSMITKHMLANMLGQAMYQVTVVMILLFAGPSFIPDIGPRGHTVEENSVHYTLIFNSFVWMQLFNEINCRKLKGEFNVFRGIFDNPLFWGILLVTAILQYLIVQFGSVAFSVADGGLGLMHWGISLLIGFMSLPVQQVINFFYRLGQRYNIYKNGKRRMKAGQLSTSNIGNTSGKASERILVSQPEPATISAGDAEPDTSNGDGGKAVPLQ